MRVIFMGSPTFAVHPLEALVAAGYEVVAVVTQPDRPAGRGGKLTPPPVKTAALALGLPVLQPATLRDPEVVATIAACAPDLGVVAAYGEILRRNVLAIPPLGFLNIHPSLLPLYRGPTPVTGAILAGDEFTGVTIIRLDPGMDSGPMLVQAVVSLPSAARAAALTDELFRLGAGLLVEAIPPYAAGSLVPRPQDHALATVTPMLTKADGQVDWSKPALVIERMIRAYDPWPGTVTTWRGQDLRLRNAVVHPDVCAEQAPGTLLGRADSGAPLILTGSGALEVTELHPAGRRPLTGTAWLNGLRELVGRMGG
ncbi:methionyl-tRNA formyltransferase [Candidatus Chloroploca sp. Khr17]|uniref:methionyl-tRNA formyltransferase n=1 Tax=Candidatus Chloroploca sp. Khr17 TaxID=2496869 RepID=UPI00101D2D14|nr:methionyl-tRNA formyltransferase [Candidatus Chloroploca sp. Khr17]